MMVKEIIGWCEDCGMEIRDGDNHQHNPYEGTSLCEKHSVSLGHLLGQWDKFYINGSWPEQFDNRQEFEKTREELRLMDLSKTEYS